MTNEFQPVLATVDWTEERARAEFDALDDDTVLLLLKALRKRFDAGVDAVLLSAIRDQLAQDVAGREAVAVVFNTMDFDNGSFFTDIGAEVYYSDGSKDHVDFSVDDQLTDGYGRVPEQALLGVNLRTGELEYEEDVPNEVYDRLGVTQNPEAQGGQR